MISKSELETIEFAKKFTRKLKGGETVGLIGELGTGKTTFVKGLAEELRVGETITSPTFVILKKYPAKIKDKKIDLVHVDAYRIENTDDFKSVGIEDFLGRDGVILVVEWAEKIREILPKNTIFIHFHHQKENTRKIEIEDDFNN